MVSKKKRPQLLSSTRPPTGKSSPSLSSRKTRSLVRTHHSLSKQLSLARATDDQSAISRVQDEIEAAGGLSKYQQASIQGQSADRGGDSSKILMKWLKDFQADSRSEGTSSKRLRMLEVGALRIDNACARSGMFDMERIDLHSQQPMIKEEDFMQRPLPSTTELAETGFDIVSLSLVINFVPDAIGRGEMLRRTSSFLRCVDRNDGESNIVFPALFLVLPGPCVTNSRYLDEERLGDIMRSLGYVNTQRKMSAKLVYSLWTYVGFSHAVRKAFKKEEIRSGRARNNFAIIVP